MKFFDFVVRMPTTKTVTRNLSKHDISFVYEPFVMLCDCKWRLVYCISMLSVLESSVQYCKREAWKTDKKLFEVFVGVLHSEEIFHLCTQRAFISRPEQATHLFLAGMVEKWWSSQTTQRVISSPKIAIFGHQEWSYLSVHNKVALTIHTFFLFICVLVVLKSNLWNLDVEISKSWLYGGFTGLFAYPNMSDNC